VRAAVGCSREYQKNTGAFTRVFTSNTKILHRANNRPKITTPLDHKKALGLTKELVGLELTETKRKFKTSFPQATQEFF
jgi:hypothetical protein